MALLAWGVEQQVKSQLGRPLDRAETYQAQQRSTPPPGVPDLAHRLETQVLPYSDPTAPGAGDDADQPVLAAAAARGATGQRRQPGPRAATRPGSWSRTWRWFCSTTRYPGRGCR